MIGRVAAALAVGSVLLTGCSDVDDLPDSSEFRACLTDTDIDPETLDSADDRRKAFADPAALECVVPLNAQEQRATLADVFATDELADALVGWIGRSDAGPEVEARAVGALAGAGADPEASDVTGGGLDQYLAVAIRHQDRPTASYQEWLADPEAQDSAPDDDPFGATPNYLAWLEDHGPGSEEYAEAQEVRALQDLVEAAREATTESD